MSNELGNRKSVPFLVLKVNELNVTYVISGNIHIKTIIINWNVNLNKFENL